MTPEATIDAPMPRTGADESPSWVVMGEQGAAVVTVVFATVSINSAILAEGDHARMIVSGIAALGTVVMAVVSMALRRHNSHSPKPADWVPQEARLRVPAIGLVLVGAIVVVSQVLLWTH